MRKCGCPELKIRIHELFFLLTMGPTQSMSNPLNNQTWDTNIDNIFKI
jgi:hypothetical protein